MKIILPCFLVFLCTSQIHAAEWDKADKILFGGFMALEIIDCGQTFNVLEKGHEQNGIIRWAHENYGDAGVFLYYATAIFGTYYVADKSPPWLRKTILSGVISFQIDTTRNNYLLGYKITF